MKMITKRLNNYIDPKLLKNSEIHNTVKKEANDFVEEKWKQI